MCHFDASIPPIPKSQCWLQGAFLRCLLPVFLKAHHGHPHGGLGGISNLTVFECFQTTFELASGNDPATIVSPVKAMLVHLAHVTGKPQSSTKTPTSRNPVRPLSGVAMTEAKAWGGRKDNDLGVRDLCPGPDLPASAQ